MDSLGRAFRPRDFGARPTFDMDTELLHNDDDFPELRDLDDEERVALMATRWEKGLDINSGEPLTGSERADWEMAQFELYSLQAFFRRFAQQNYFAERRASAEANRSVRESSQAVFLGSRPAKRTSCGTPSVVDASRL